MFQPLIFLLRCCLLRLRCLTLCHCCFLCTVSSLQLSPKQAFCLSRSLWLTFFAHIAIFVSISGGNGSRLQSHWYVVFSLVFVCHHCLCISFTLFLHLLVLLEFIWVVCVYWFSSQRSLVLLSLPTRGMFCIFKMMYYLYLEFSVCLECFAYWIGCCVCLNIYSEFVLVLSLGMFDPWQIVLNLCIVWARVGFESKNVWYLAICIWFVDCIVYINLFTLRSHGWKLDKWKLN